MRAAERTMVALFALFAPVSVVGLGQGRAPIKNSTSAVKVGMISRKITPPNDFEWRGSKERVLRVIAWYPAQAVANEVEIAFPAAAPQWVVGRAAIDAPAAGAGRYPLIVMSHGTGGSAIQLGWLGVALARRGFVAVAVDHPGNNLAEPYTPEGFVLRWERARDLGVLIDGVLDDEVLGKMVDPSRIGAAGFSLGGYTVLEIAGGRTDLAAFQRYCGDHAQECAPPLDFSVLIRQFNASDPKVRASLGRAGASYRDTRVRAAFAIAPALGHSFTPAGLASVAIPVRIVVGDADPIAPAESNAAYCAANIKGARLDTLSGVGHFTFLPTAKTKGDRQPLAVDRPGIDRAAIHEHVAEMAAEFFGEALVVPVHR